MGKGYEKQVSHRSGIQNGNNIWKDSLPHLWSEKARLKHLTPGSLGRDIEVLAGTLAHWQIVNRYFYYSISKLSSLFTMPYNAVSSHFQLWPEGNIYGMDIGNNKSLLRSQKERQSRLYLLTQNTTSTELCYTQN